MPIARDAAFLIVEDNLELGRLLARVLTQYGDAVHVTTIAEALEKLGDDSYAWVAIITDVGLPDGAGMDFVRVVRRDRPELSILVLSGMGVPEHEVTSLGASFATKPAALETIEEFASAALARVSGRVRS